MFRIRGKGPVNRLARKDKALMIEAVLTVHMGHPPREKRILDIGCGNGDISQHFAEHNEQYGVDVDDKRRPENTMFQFAQVKSARLPFDDDYFDIVISHHVIEHMPDQEAHLSEIRRVLKEGGSVYLATPNKSSPIMQGHIGNDLVLHYHQMWPLFKRMGFEVQEYSVDLLKSPGTFHSDVKYLYWVPRIVLRWLRDLYPSHVFVLSKADL